MKQPSSHWRSWSFWASLSAGIALVPLIVVAGAVFWLRSTARAQREAVAAIKAERGQVVYPWQDPETSNTPIAFSQSPLLDWLPLWTSSGNDSDEPSPAAPAWLVTLLGVDCFGDVTSVVMPPRVPGKLMEQLRHLEHLKKLRVQHALASDQEMECIGRLAHLESLSIVRTRVLKGGFAHLANLKKLQTLSLQGTTFNDDAALACLKGLTALTEIDLAGTAITSAGMESLRELINLEDLNLSRTMITDAGLSQLSGLTALSRLSLKGTRLNGTGLVSLKGLSRLEELDMEGTGVGDAGLAHLAGLINLKVLRLKGTVVGDGGVACLTGLTNLEELTLDRTDVTDSGLASLAVLPHLAILSVQHTKVTDGAVTAQIRKRAQLQVQQLAASSTGVVDPARAITELEIVH